MSTSWSQSSTSTTSPHFRKDYALRKLPWRRVTPVHRRKCSLQSNCTAPAVSTSVSNGATWTAFPTVSLFNQLGAALPVAVKRKRDCASTARNARSFPGSNANHPCFPTSRCSGLRASDIDLGIRWRTYSQRQLRPESYRPEDDDP